VHWTEHKAVDPLIVLSKWILGLAVAYQMAVITWLIVDKPTLVLPEPSRAQSVATASAGTIHDMASWDLFGKADAIVEVQQEEINAPKTRLRLSLMGVFVSATPSQSSAIIAEQGREGEFFKVGDRVQGRTKLSQVYEDKVILDNSGKLETLTFDEKKNSASGFVAEKKKRPVPVNKKKNVSPKDFKKALRGIRTPEQFVDFAKEQLEDPVAAMNNLGLKATGNGYVLNSSASMLSGIGMKKGDKLISVNGHSLGDPAQDKLIIDEVYQSGSAKIVIERGSRRMTINHSF
jgi:general secretion pathway protein C